MKIKKIESLIKKEKSIMFQDGWIGTSRAVYPAYQFENLTADNILTMFDIDEEKRKNIVEIEPDVWKNADPEDKLNDDIELCYIGLNIHYMGEDLRPYYYEDNILFVDQKLLAPIADAKEGLTLCVRIGNTGKPYVCAFSGMLLIGIIEPADVDTSVLRQNLTSIVRRIEVAER